jgi:hypothetical protein
MVSTVRFSEISESTHRILNPFSVEQVLSVGEICRLKPGDRHLDLASGKGEMLCQYAQRHGVLGLGIDSYPPFVEVAEQRARELGVADKVRFVVGDAAQHEDESGRYDVVSCIGATWLGGGLGGTVDLMRGWAKPGAWLLVGEPYWIEDPPDALRESMEATQTFADLGGTLARFEEADLDLVEMVLSTTESWDRYEASQWLNVADWLAANPDDPDAGDVRATRDYWRRTYLTDSRRCLGWGVFVLRS